MNQKVIELIGAKTAIIKKFIEADEPWQVPMNDGAKTGKEITDEYAKAINYSNKVLKHMADVNYILYILVEAKNKVTPNTPSGQQVIKQITSLIEPLRYLYKALDNINTSYGWVLQYYKSGGGLI